MTLVKAFLLLLVLGSLPFRAVAGENPVVVELFSSQGCSTCPPADALLREISDRPDVIALSLHVDYWDYIGWTDTLASADNTRRQQGYAHAAHARTIYTPQFIIAGQEPIGGAQEIGLEQMIEAHRQLADSVRISVRDDGNGKITISAEPLDPIAGPVWIELVRYVPSATVDITRGENKGRRIVYANVVTSWQTLGTWSGKGRLSVEAPYSGDERGVVVLQTANYGPILAAARID